MVFKKENTVKRISRILLLGSILPLMAANCEKNPDNPPVPEGLLETVTYTASDENFPNPERGFYVASEVFNANGKGIAEASLKAARLQGRTLFLLEFHMDDYVASDISEEYMQTIRAKLTELGADI